VAPWLRDFVGLVAWEGRRRGRKGHMKCVGVLVLVVKKWTDVGCFCVEMLEIRLVPSV